MIFTRYGVIKNNHLILYKLNTETIPISAVTEIKISKSQTKDCWKLSNHFKNNRYDFTITMDNSKEITFSFGRSHLLTALSFKTLLWHTQFNLQKTILNQ
jgi:hypothetical protein